MTDRPDHGALPALGEPAPLAAVVRGGLVESRHRGHLVALGPDGAVLLQRGDPDGPGYPRSALKPVQALALLRTGVALTDEQLVLACASHDGSDSHLAVVRSTLTSVGLSPADLQCPADWPLDGSRPADGRTAERMNCSGKHAAMLAACVHAGWSTADYRDPGHPLQRWVASTVSELAGPVSAVTVDGCGAPLFAVPLRGLARAFGVLAVAPAGTAEHRVADVIRRFPLLLGGPARPVSQLLQALPGLIAKDGAEGVFAAALPDGTAVAVKVDDGANRAAVVAAVAALAAVGADVAGVPEDLRWPPVLGGGVPVGRLLPAD